MIVILKDNMSLLSLTIANSVMPKTLDHTFSNRCWLKVPVSNTVMYRLFWNAKCKEDKLSPCPDSPIKETTSTGIMTLENWLSQTMNTAWNPAFKAPWYIVLWTQIQYHIQDRLSLPLFKVWIRHPVNGNFALKKLKKIYRLTLECRAVSCQ